MKVTLMVSDHGDASLGDRNPLVGILFNLPTQPRKGEEIDWIAEFEIQEQVEAVEDALRRLKLRYELFPIKDDISDLAKTIKSSRPDVVVNISEGAFGDSSQEMNTPAFLELLRIPYTGSPPLTLGLCQNKGLTKDVLMSNMIPTPSYRILTSFQGWDAKMDYPLFVKPLNEDGSLGISKKSYVKNNAELRSQIKYIVELYNQPALVEEYLNGREFTVSIVGNKELEILPISEIIFDTDDEPKIRDYSAKWNKKSDEYKKTKMICPVKLKTSLEDKIKDVASKAYRVLRCRDYGRVDVRLKGKKPYVLEVNPNPDISTEGSLPYSLKAAGIPFEAFVEKILLFALRRGDSKHRPTGTPL